MSDMLMGMISKLAVRRICSPLYLFGFARRYALAAIALAAALALPVLPASAQTASGNLTALMDSGLFAYNGLEVSAAKTNDAAYAALLTICAPSPAGVPPAAGACTGNTLNLFNRLRELEDTANELLGRGETAFSLRLGAQALGFALRWTAPEEFAAQGSLTTKFANSQMTTLAGRFSAMRFATLVARLANNGDDPASDSDTPRLASYSSGNPRGGAAGADSPGIFSAGNWSGVANGSYSAGTKSATTFEDAFNFNDTEYSAGTDLRINSHLTVGVLAGYMINHVNFNSSESIVAGGIRGEGYSAIAYAQLAGDSAYVNFSLGFQHLNLDTRRSITYPSLNPLIPSVNETSTSSASANSWITNIGSGYAFHFGGFSVEPYLTGQYVHTGIGQFVEHDGSGFDISVDSQTIPSFTTSAGLKLQQAFLPPFGVIVPYVYAEYRHEFLENSRNIESAYGDSGVTNSADFNLPTDAPTRNYYVAGAGLTVALKHGVQGFVQYIKILQFANYTDYVASGGIRIEF
jgi:outer membrane lipase/esterase